MRAVVFALLYSAFLAPALAGLQWEQTELNIEAGPLDEKVETAFRFTNASDATVTIAETRAACGCTVPTLDKREYAPGESGEIRVVYTFGDSMGRQEKILTVLTTGPEERSYVLTLAVNIPGLWEVHPRFVKWEHGEAKTPKTVRIRALHPELAAPVSVESRDTRFQANLRAIPDEPGVFEVALEPAQTDEPMMSSVTVVTSAPPERKRDIQLYAVVR